MDIFAITTVLIVLSALFGYINARFLKMPNTIGLMSITILFTLVVIALRPQTRALVPGPVRWGAGAIGP